MGQQVLSLLKSDPGANGNEGTLHIPESSKSGTPPLDVI